MAAYERLSVSDRLFLDMETPEANLHVASCFVFDAGPLRTDTGGIDFERISAFVESRLYRIPRYRQRIRHVPIEGDPIWVDDPTFNLQYHIRQTHLPLPGDERQLKRLCGRIVSQLLDRGKPLWEMWVVDGLEGDRFAVITKIHHCMIDGVGGVELAGNLFSPEPLASFEFGPRWIPRPQPSRRELIQDAVRRRLREPGQLAGRLARAVREPGETWDELSKTLRGLREAGGFTTSPASVTPINGPIGGHRRFDWTSFEIDAMREIKRQFGGTLNDIALSILCGGFDRFFELRGIPSRAQQNLDFRASCPVNVRSAEEAGEIGNHVSILIVPVPLGESDPERRLARVREAMKEGKASNQARAMTALEHLGEITHPALLTYFAQATIEKQSSNFVFTNVPGPRAPWYLLESQLLAAYPVVPLMPTHGVGIAAMSYDGVFYLGFNADWEQVPDLHELILGTQAAFEALHAAARADAEGRPGDRRTALDAAPGALAESTASNGGASAGDASTVVH